MVRLKEQVRVCGIDDAPFEFGNRSARATVIGAVVRAPAYLEGVLRFDVAVDGCDATDEIAKALSKSRFLEQIRAVMIDGIALAGFNIVDIRNLSGRLGIPVVTVTRDRPDMRSIESALSKHFEDWKERLRIISDVPLLAMETENKPIFVSYAGTSEGEALRLIKATTVKGAIPEPIRMAHIVAGGVTRGESKGKA
jgi:endonuclease V-like protein UPF0215 family